MTPEEVPSELVDAAVDAWHEAAPALLDDELRQVLAAVLPTHESSILKRAAEEARASAGQMGRSPELVGDMATLLWFAERLEALAVGGVR